MTQYQKYDIVSCSDGFLKNPAPSLRLYCCTVQEERCRFCVGQSLAWLCAAAVASTCQPCVCMRFANTAQQKRDPSLGAMDNRKRSFPTIQAVSNSPVQNEPTMGTLVPDDDLDGELYTAPTDAEATIMLLASMLYPDPAVAAAAASAARQSRHAKRSKSAAGPSKATAAAITAAAAAAAAAKQLPPMILKSQVYTVLADRTTADRDLEGLRQQGKIRVFKLAMGADEYVLLLAPDYIDIINRLLLKHQQLAAQPQQQQEQQQQQNDTAEAASTAATLQLFRDNVASAWYDASIPRATLLQLLRAPAPPQPCGACRSGSPHASKSAARSGGHTTAAGSAEVAASDAARERHLLALDLVTRDSRSPASYLLTVPGAAPFVRSVLAGRQEMLQLLSRKKYQEALETELSCVKLRNSCLTPTFILRDLQGKGLVTVANTTAGRLIRLAQRK